MHVKQIKMDLAKYLLGRNQIPGYVYTAQAQAHTYICMYTCIMYNNVYMHAIHIYVGYGYVYSYSYGYG